MPNWLNLDFIILNWQPLVVALVLGYILGWMFTGSPAGRRARAAEERSAEVESRMRRSERELTEVRVQGETTKTRMTALQSDLDAAKVRIADFEEAAKALATASLLQAEASAHTAADDADAAFPSPDDALPGDDSLDAELDMQTDEQTPSEADSASHDAVPYIVAAAARAAEVQIGEPDTEDEAVDIAADFRTIAQRIDAVPVPDNKDIALAEAYAHAATLQNELEKSDNAMRMQQADIEALRAQVQAANAARHELETRLVHAREDVASELAVLASTMIKMKDDALGRADARIAALDSELNAVRHAANRALETHVDAQDA